MWLHAEWYAEHFNILINIMCIIIFELLMFNFHGLRVYGILYVIN